MTYYLIEYNRERGELVKFERFEQTELERANRARLELELSNVDAGIDNEVVVLDAESEDDLRRTHRRYFASIKELARPYKVVKSTPKRSASSMASQRDSMGDRFQRLHSREITHNRPVKAS